MMRSILRAKLHMATVTESELEYEGSITIDKALLKKSGILPYEQVVVSNLNNGERFETYAIIGKRGSGEMVINGAAAHKASTGDLIIVACYVHVNAEEAAKHKPSLVYVDATNAIADVKNGMESANIAAIK